MVVCMVLSVPHPSENVNLFPISVTFSFQTILIFLAGLGPQVLFTLEKEREKNINAWLPLARPSWGPGPQPRHVP